jgi:peptidoglycan-N-acetylmuramic acid deacetylase
MRVALTFDAEHGDFERSDSEGNPAAVLDALARQSTRATFFVQGRWASAYPALVARMVAEGHDVGHHSDHHAPMTLLTDSGVREDVSWAEERIEKAAGQPIDRYFRYPFGRGDARVGAIIADMGYSLVGWTLDSGDWDSTRVTDASALTQWAADADLAVDPTVILFHTWPDATGQAIDDVVETFMARGAELVPISDLQEHEYS